MACCACPSNAQRSSAETPMARSRHAKVCRRSCTRTRSRPAAQRARSHPLLFIESTRPPRKGSTQIGCRPRCVCTIDQAASLRIATWSRRLLNDSAGMTKTLRPNSGMATSQSHCRPQTLPAIAKARVDREKRHALQVGGQSREQAILFVPCDWIGWTAGLLEHGEQGRDALQPGRAIFVAVRARGAVEDRARDFMAAIDRRGAGAESSARLDERCQGRVVNLARLQVAEVGQQQSNMNL